jgi:hypothetical protein
MAGGRTKAVLNERANNPNAPSQPEPPEVKSARKEMETDLRTFSSTKYRDEAASELLNDKIANGQKFKLPTNAEIDAHIETKKLASKKKFNDFYDAYSKKNPKANTPDRFVNYNPDTQSFDPIPDDEDETTDDDQ